jgi:beta-lactam-binding protein with PASTA domain
VTYAIAASGTSDGPVSGTFDGPINATVPDLSGMSPVVASIRLSLAKLETGDTHSVFNEEHVGQVFRQSPGPNEVVPRGSKVEFWYGFGRTVTMPDLRGSGLVAARQTIADSGLKLGQVDDPQHCGGTGPIVRQRPDPGKPVSIGSEVRLTLGRSAYVRVPPLVGLSVSAANAALAAADLVRGTSERIVSDRPPGEVLAQSPPAGDSVPRGSGVVLNLAIAAPDSAESTTVHPPTLVTVPPRGWQVPCHGNAQVRGSDSHAAHVARFRLVGGSTSGTEYPFQRLYEEP